MYSRQSRNKADWGEAEAVPPGPIGVCQGQWSGDYNIPEIGAEEAVKVH
jgi:hypothetical protein